MSHSLWHHGLQHVRPPCPSPTCIAYSNSRTSSRWCHPAISSSVVSSSCLQSLPASGSFPLSQFFTSGGQSIGASASASASVLPMNIPDWFPLGLTENQLTETSQILFSDPHSGLPFTRHFLFDHCWFSSLILKKFLLICLILLLFCFLLPNYWERELLWSGSTVPSFSKRLFWVSSEK